MPLTGCRRDAFRKARRDEKLGDVDRIELVALVAELAVNLDVPAFLDHAVNLLAAEHLQHSADLFARARAFEARIGRLEMMHVLLPEEAPEKRSRLFAEQFVVLERAA